MSGFLLIEDGLPLRSDVSALHVADFDFIIEQSDVKSYQGLLYPVRPPLPFGFDFAPRLENGVDSHSDFIVPADVMDRRDARAWRFRIEPWRHKPDAPENLVLRHQGRAVALSKTTVRKLRPYFPHTSFATSTASFSFAHCSSSVRMLPSSVEAKPHCGDSAS
jgi:hypothetical protein